MLFVILLSLTMKNVIWDQFHIFIITNFGQEAQLQLTSSTQAWCLPSKCPFSNYLVQELILYQGRITYWLHYQPGVHFTKFLLIWRSTHTINQVHGPLLYTWEIHQNGVVVLETGATKILSAMAIMAFAIPTIWFSHYLCIFGHKSRQLCHRTGQIWTIDITLISVKNHLWPCLIEISLF